MTGSINQIEPANRRSPLPCSCSFFVRSFQPSFGFVLFFFAFFWRLWRLFRPGVIIDSFFFEEIMQTSGTCNLADRRVEDEDEEEEEEEEEIGKVKKKQKKTFNRHRNHSNRSLGVCGHVEDSVCLC